MNTLLMNNNVDEKKTFNSGQAVNFAKNIISKNELEEESTLKKIIESVKDVKLKEQKD